MRQKLAKSAKSTNFWTNVSTIASAVVGGILLTLIKDPAALQNGALLLILTNALHNAGNILAHMNSTEVQIP